MTRELGVLSTARFFFLEPLESKAISVPLLRLAHLLRNAHDALHFWFAWSTPGPAWSSDAREKVGLGIALSNLVTLAEQRSHGIESKRYYLRNKTGSGSGRPQRKA